MQNYTQSNELYHHGILGMKWGVRRYQNPDGSLTNAGRRRLAREEKRMDKKDLKWADKNYNRIYKKAYKSSKSELNDYVKNELSKSGKVGKYLINDYNKKLAELMNKNISEISALLVKSFILWLKEAKSAYIWVWPIEDMI